MKKKVTGIVASGFIILTLLLAACAPAPEEKAPAPTTPAAPAAPAAPAVKETAPAVKEAAPAETAGMVKLTLTKTDGTKVEKLVETPQYGGVLTTFLTTPVAYWDGDRGTWHDRIWEHLMIWDWTRGPAGTGEWDGLYPFALSMKPFLDGGLLATGWEMPDPNTMVFHIRKGVHFQNKAPAFGREMNAYDVEFALRRSWTFPTSFNTRAYTARDHFPNASVEEAIKATDKWTLVLKTLPAAMGAVYEVGTTRYACVVPPEILKYDMNDWRNQGGTGAFEVLDYVPGSTITYRRNPNYWMTDPLHPQNQLPYLDGWKELIIPDASTRLAAMRTAKIDKLSGARGGIASGSLSWEDASQLMKTNPELKYQRYTASSVDAIFMRVDKPELPQYDIRVRRALAMAIDNQAIKDELYGGQAEILAWPVDKNIGAYAGIWIPLEEYPEVVQKMFGYYPEEAKKLMVEAGYPNGFKVEVIAQATDVDVLSIVAAYWKKNLNVELDIQVREPAVWTAIETYNTHKEMIAQGLHKGATKLMSVRVGRDDRNSARITDTRTEEVLWKTMEIYFTDPLGRDKLLRDVSPYIWEHAWVIQFPDPYIYSFWWPWVKNYYGINSAATFDSWMFHKYIWLDLDMKETMIGRR